MKVTTRGRYALRFMIYLAKNVDHGHISLKDAAKDQEISMKYLEQIVPYLTKENLVKSTRGAKGGYNLTKPADEYNVREILEAVEGKVCLVDCSRGNIICSRISDCKTSPLWMGLSEAIRDYLSNYKLSDLVGEVDALCDFDETFNL